jgi:hypothetical protein
MKKFLVTILAITYLTVSSGVVFSIHYCMGKVASVDLMHSSEKCDKCGMKKSGGCCKDEFKMVKLTDSHKLIVNGINTNAPVAIIDNAKSLFDADLFLTGAHPTYNNHSPPDPPGPSLNILYCVFRI